MRMHRFTRTSIDARSHPRLARALAVALAALLGAAVTLSPAFSAPARAAGSGSLPACPFWSTATPPARTPSPWVPPLQTAPAVDFTSRLPAPGGVTGDLANGQVTITFDRVPGAQAYRVWRNGQSVAEITDWGQSALTVVDGSPCQNAYYTVAAMADTGDSDASEGQLSAPYQLSSTGVVVPWQIPVGSTISMMVTAYNDVGQTASGYNAQLGLCAVDPRIIPWGTYFSVPGYGTCYAADIGTWIQNDTVDVWLPGSQANGWGVQDRTVTLMANPYQAPPSSPTPTPTATPTHTPSQTPTPTPTPTPTGNLVLNGGFESGALSPWTCDAATATVTGNPVHSGAHALAITPTSSDDAQCSQSVAVAPDTTYTLTGWVQGSYVYLGASDPGGAGGSTWTPSTSGWTKLSTTFTTGASTTSVSLYVHGWYAEPADDIDDISLVG